MDQQSNAHLVTAANSGNTELTELSELVSACQEAKELWDAAEAAAKQCKKNYLQLNQEVIPDYMLQRGLSKVVTADGLTVQVQQKVSASVKDMPTFIEFLDAKGDSSMLRTHMDIGKLPSDMVEAITEQLLTEHGVVPNVTQKIHTATLSKYVKEICAIDTDEVPQATIAELESMLTIFMYNRTTIKKGKK